jgi:GT2 family glycosyltransferase
MSDLPSDPLPAPPEPPVGVVVATRNRRDSLLNTLAHLRALSPPPPIVVVDNASSDGTEVAVRLVHPAVELISLPKNIGAGARNVGVRRIGTPYVAFADDDSWWAEGSFQDAALLFSRYPQCALIAARVLLGADANTAPMCDRLAASPLKVNFPLPGPAILGFLACGAIVRRDAFLAAGGFESRLGIGGEEQLLAIDLARRGWGLAYVDSIVAHHWPSAARDVMSRRRVQERNDLWTAWLRRRPKTAWERTRNALRAARHDPTARAALLDAVRGLPRVLRNRHRVPPTIEQELASLERD